MNYQCQIERREAKPTLVMQTRVSVQQLPQFLARAFAAVIGHLGMIGEAPAGAPFVAYHNMDMANLEIEAGFPVARKIAGAGEIKPGFIPGGDAATCLHVGPYDQLRAVYEALTEFIAANGRKAKGVAYELYLNDPTTVEPGKLETKVVFPLE
ncbi:MAG: GyrI-like domain-containing protein [Myxococcales bacterium]